MRWTEALVLCGIRRLLKHHQELRAAGAHLAQMQSFKQAAGACMADDEVCILHHLLQGRRKVEPLHLHPHCCFSLRQAQEATQLCLLCTIKASTCQDIQSPTIA